MHYQVLAMKAYAQLWCSIFISFQAEYLFQHNPQVDWAAYQPNTPVILPVTCLILLLGSIFDHATSINTATGLTCGFHCFLWNTSFTVVVDMQKKQ